MSKFLENSAESPEEIEQELIDSVEEFTETVVREVMVPRVDVEFLAADDSLETALAQFIATGYSRLPVTGKTVDDIVGIAFLKDVARIAHEDSSRLANELVAEVARQPYFVPESRSVAELLREMQRGGIQLVVVSDEYGGVAGIASFEDLIEELVGDIADEYDRATEEIQIVSPDQVRVSPRLSLEELAETFSIVIEESEVETVAGWFSKLLGRLPSGGERVTSSGLVLVAERVDAKRNRIISILVSRDQAVD
jgi:CBS domain containing-hemolysin-like protein